MVWPAVIAAAAALGGGALAAKGQRDANAANMLLSDENRKWMEAMSDTSYQRAVKDLGRAGLNPMLAYSQGGASVPSAAAPVMQNVLGAGVGAASSTAQQAIGLMQGAQQMEQSQAVTDKLRSETMSKDVNTARAVQEIKRLMAEADKAGHSASKEAYEALSKKWDMDVRSKLEDEEVRQRRAQSKLTELEVPKSEAEAKFYEGLGSMNPYLRMLIELLRGGSSARQIIK